MGASQLDSIRHNAKGSWKVWLPFLFWAICGASLSLAQEVDFLVKGFVEFKIPSKSPVNQIQLLKKKGKVYQPVAKVQTVKKKSFDFILPLGIYRVRFRAVLGSGKFGPWQKTKPQKTPYPKVETLLPEFKALSGNQREVLFRWKKSPFINTYTFRYLILPLGSWNDIETDKTQVSVNLPEQTVVKWQVKAKGEVPKGEKIGEKVVVVGKAREGLRQPVFFQKSATQATWRPDKQAEAFEVELRVLKGNQWQTVFQDTQKVNSLLLDEKTEVDLRYQLRVRAIKKGLPPSEWGEMSFIGGDKPPEGRDLDLLKDLSEDQLEGEADLPPTILYTQVAGSYGGASVNATGVIGEFSGSGSLSGGQLDFEFLPEPTQTMLMVRVHARSEQFETITEVKPEGSETLEEKTVSLAPNTASLSVTGKSDLEQEFYGFGVQLLFTQIPKLIPLDSEGRGSLELTELIGLGFVYHQRFALGPGYLVVQGVFGPAAGRTSEYLLFEGLLEYRWFFTEALGMTFATRGRSIYALMERDCYTFDATYCGKPRTSMLSGGAMLGVFAQF